MADVILCAALSTGQFRLMRFFFFSFLVQPEACVVKMNRIGKAMSHNYTKVKLNYSTLFNKDVLIIKTRFEISLYLRDP